MLLDQLCSLSLNCFGCFKIFISVSTYNCAVNHYCTCECLELLKIARKFIERRKTKGIKLLNQEILKEN